MTWKRILGSLVSGAVMLIISFILTNIAYMMWADWRYPGSSSMAGMGALVLGLIVAPICALVTTGLVLSWPDHKKSS